MERSSTDQTILATILQPKHAKRCPMTTMCQALPWPPRPDMCSINTHMVYPEFLSYACLAQVMLFLFFISSLPITWQTPINSKSNPPVISERVCLPELSAPKKLLKIYFVLSKYLLNEKWSFNKAYARTSLKFMHANHTKSHWENSLWKGFHKGFFVKVRSWPVWFFYSSECVVWKS